MVAKKPHNRMQDGTFTRLAIQQSSLLKKETENSRCFLFLVANLDRSSTRNVSFILPNKFHFHFLVSQYAFNRFNHNYRQTENEIHRPIRFHSIHDRCDLSGGPGTRDPITQMCLLSKFSKVERTGRLCCQTFLRLNLRLQSVKLLLRKTL